MTEEMKASEDKKHWKHTMPYPRWPFGTVSPKQLKKWMDNQQAREYEPALF